MYIYIYNAKHESMIDCKCFCINTWSEFYCCPVGVTLNRVLDYGALNK